MADQAAFKAPGESDAKRWVTYVIGGLLILGILWFVYRQLTVPVTIKAKDERTITAAPDLLPPPPPPPPPPPEPQEKPPEPTETPLPSPEPAAKPDAPAPMQMDAAPSAGSDSFGLSAGKGGGMGGTGSAGTCLKPPCGGGGGGGFSDAMYRGNLGRELQDRILDNEKVNRLAFKAVFAISVGSAGQVTSAELLSSTGDSKRDQILLAILKSTRGLEAPPSQVRFPQRVTVTGRRSF